MKSIYMASWLVVAAAVLVSVFTGAMTPTALVTYSLVTLGLVFILMLWSVVANTKAVEA